MSDVTRDEIRKAAEAVGWGWCSTAHQTWAERLEDETLFLVTDDPDVPGGEMPTCFECDALALLEATGEPSQVRCAPRNRITKYAVTINGRAWHYAPTLPAAAVRAVNAWAESKEKSK